MKVNPSGWWTVFNDPALDSLICTAYHQNLTSAEAGFPCSKCERSWGSTRASCSRNAADDGQLQSQCPEQANRQRFEYCQAVLLADDLRFNLAWELDFWGRFRRAIEADESTLDQQVELYDSALVTLLGDIATNYGQMRTLEQQIKYAQDNVQVQARHVDDRRGPLQSQHDQRTGR